MGEIEGGDAWGAHSLTLELPSFKIQFRGLSSGQHNSLRESYEHFVSSTAGSADVVCNAIRLAHHTALSVDELTLNGQYVPKKVRREDLRCYSVTGINFEASIALDTGGVSFIGVVDEHSFSHANVIENYLRILSAHRVLGHKGVVLHSAGLVLNDKAYIFSGRSNAGKTTLTRKGYARGAYVLSDDINLVLPGESGYEANAVPFTGEFGRTLEHVGGKKSYPVAGIILLEQGDCLQAMPVSHSIAVARLLTGCPFVNTDEFESEALFNSVKELVMKIPVIRLLNQRSDSFDDIMAAVREQLAKSN